MKKLTWLIIVLLLVLPGMKVDLIAAVVIIPEASNTDTVVSSDSVTYYLQTFSNLSKREKKQRIKEAKKTARYYKSAKDSGANPDGDIVFLAILAVLIPPLAVYLKEKAINKRFWITLLLWFLFILPGIVFALLVVFGVI